MDKKSNLSELFFKTLSEKVKMKYSIADSEHVILVDEQGQTICKFYGKDKLVINQKFVLTKLMTRNFYTIVHFIEIFKGRDKI